MSAAVASPARNKRVCLRDDAQAALAPPGEELRDFLCDCSLVLRHGTSLALMARASTFLNQTGDFEAVDPTSDWEKWASRRPELRLYYWLLEDPARDGDDAVSCALRAVLDGVDAPTAAPRRPRWRRRPRRRARAGRAS